MGDADRKECIVIGLLILIMLIGIGPATILAIWGE